MCSKANSKRAAWVSLLLALALTCGIGIVGGGALPASAAEEYPLTSFAMEDGASVRMDDKKALRFTTSVAKSELDAVIAAEGKENVRVVTMITYTSALDGVEEFVKDSVFTADVVFSAANGNLYGVSDGENYEYRACLFGLEDKNIAKEFSARSYIQAGEEVLAYTAYSAENNSRSAYDVAKAAIENREYVVEDDEELTAAQLANLQYLSADFTVTVEAEGYETQEITVKRGESLAEHIEGYYEAIGVNGTCEKIPETYEEVLNAPVSENKTVEVEIVEEHDFAENICTVCGAGLVFVPENLETVYTQKIEYALAEETVDGVKNPLKCTVWAGSQSDILFWVQPLLDKETCTAAGLTKVKIRLYIDSATLTEASAATGSKIILFMPSADASSYTAYQVPLDRWVEYTFDLDTFFFSHGQDGWLPLLTTFNFDWDDGVNYFADDRFVIYLDQIVAYKN